MWLLFLILCVNVRLFLQFFDLYIRSDLYVRSVFHYSVHSAYFVYLANPGDVLFTRSAAYSVYSVYFVYFVYSVYSVYSLEYLFYPFKISFSVQSTSLHLSPSSERARPPPIKVIEFFII